jgi:hypothetical protein
LGQQIRVGNPDPDRPKFVLKTEKEKYFTFEESERPLYRFKETYRTVLKI